MKKGRLTFLILSASLLLIISGVTVYSLYIKKEGANQTADSTDEYAYQDSSAQTEQSKDVSQSNSSANDSLNRESPEKNSQGNHDLDNNSPDSNSLDNKEDTNQETVDNGSSSDENSGSSSTNSNNPRDTSENQNPTDAEEGWEEKKPIVLAFAGDVNFDEDSKPVKKYDSEKKGILGCLSEDLLHEMISADIMMLNNEFAYSLRGTEEKNKSYTFRAKPDRVNILKEMGVDIVSLANNHALDFGVEALLDTFTTLDEAKIDYVGAGETMDRAKAPIYYTIGDYTIAFVAASRVIFAVDWYATDTRPGMIGTYDPALFLSSIKEAKANSDFVVVYVHWGVERTNYPVDYQKSLARKYIDAGADAVIGCHPHVMQGIEMYKGKPIAYSLGNYWFNAATQETGLLKIYINPDGTTKVQLLPAMAKNTYTYLIHDEKERDAYYKFMEKISFDVRFDKDGFIIEAENDGE